MAKKVTTLFIRDTAINLLVMKSGLVEKWARLPLEPGLVCNGLIVDEAQVAARVKELFRLEGISTRNVIVGLTGLNSVYRVLTLPELPDAILPEAVRREAERVIPVPFDEVYLSYQPLPASAGERRIFLTAFPRNVADALLRTLRRAGVKPYIMDLAPLALCRTVDEPRAIIINARLDHLGIMVIADRIPQVIRRLSLPSEAESLSLSEKLPVITEELSRTVAFYNSSHQENPLDSTVPVFVCGEPAEAPETWQSLVGESGYSVSVLPSPVEYPEGFSPNEFMVNIGLALKKLLPEKKGANFSLVNFNALPEAYLPKGMALTNVLVPVGITVGIGLVTFMVFLVQNTMADIEVLRSRLAVTESDIGRINTETTVVQEQIEQVEAQVKLVTAQIGLVEATAGVFGATLTSLEEGREEVDGDLSQIVTLATGKVNLTGVSHAGDTVTVRGIAPDEAEIFSYARDLRNRGRFQAVFISSITQKGGEVMPFSFTFHLEN
ncbi:pilus assembly protein PilM [Dehalococcoidia bacterium]|nr:pilus assembly protein PilM [Dehalococcoidia bacterium]